MKYIIVGPRDQVMTLKLVSRAEANEFMAEYPPEVKLRIESIGVENVDPERVAFLEARLTAITQWLEENKPEVFREGLWDAVHAASPTSAIPNPDYWIWKDPTGYEDQVMDGDAGPIEGFIPVWTIPVTPPPEDKDHE